MRCKTVATWRMRILCAAFAAFAWSGRAGAEPLRLKGDAIAETRAPAGLVVLEGQDKVRPWVDAEGLVWAGARSDPTADVMVLALRLREPRGFGEFKGGRFVVATGAIRPVQIDGASGIARAPWGTTLEAFGGAPVVPRFGDRAYDWLAGGRVGQNFDGRTIAGFSYLQRRTHGDISNHEVGADLAAAPARWLDFAAKSAYDLTSPGIAEASASIATRRDPWRFEVFASHRSPSRLLPATSLFSVLGDFPSQSLGGTVKWRAAPRLDLFASGAGQDVGGELGGNGTVRATLRLDDEGQGSLGLEFRRQDVATAKWSGVRVIATEPLGAGFRASTELEVAAPDEPRGRGAVWPWGLVAIAWRSGNGWEIAGASEAASTPEHRYEINGLVRISRALEVR
jgi:hypothetical protein